MPPVPPMNQSSSKVVVYQIMTRLFGNTNTTNKPFGTLAENGVGKFNDISHKALESIKGMGITHVWYTGVIEHATLTDYTAYGIPLDDADVVKGRAGSPYAIKDYYDVNPDLAVNVNERMTEFEALIERTHQTGLKVIIDFVPNHVARAYKSDKKPASVRDLGEDDDKTVRFKASNNFYYLPGESFQVPSGYVPLGRDSFPTKDGQFIETPAKVTGNDQFTASPGINEWFETVKLNYGVDIENNRTTHFDPVPDTWVKMKDILVYWAGKKVDGFRCDMAEMVPVEFWSWAIPQVKAVNPEIIFIAEIYNPAQYRNYLNTGRFDFLYDKVQLYDTLRLLINGKRQTRDIAAIQDDLKDINRHMLHFLENHDEQRVASKYFAGDPWRAVSAMVVSATIDAGPVMIYFGQEVGEPGLKAEGFQGDDGRTTIFDYWGVPEHQKWMDKGTFSGDTLSASQKSLRKFYSTLLNLTQREAIRTGAYYDVTQANVEAKNFGDDVHAFIRAAGEDRLLIISNFSPRARKVKVTIPADILKNMGMVADTTYNAQDLLWSSLQTSLVNGEATVELGPYNSFILSITP